jgi:hypothetical protein
MKNDAHHRNAPIAIKGTFTFLKILKQDQMVKSLSAHNLWQYLAFNLDEAHTHML